MYSAESVNVQSVSAQKRRCLRLGSYSVLGSCRPFRTGRVFLDQKGKG